MRIRSIKPEFWRSDDITSLSIEDRLLFIGLWSYVDDNGVGRGDEALIVADLFATDHYRDPRETVARVSGGLARLSSKGLVTLYRVDGKPYIYVCKWDQHQRVDKPNKPRYPGPDRQDSADPEILAEPSRDSRDIPAPGAEEQGSRGTGEQRNSSSTSDEVEEGAQKRTPRRRATRIPDPFTVNRDMRQWAASEVPGLDVDASTRTFVDYWRAESGAKASKVDWVATWRNWLRKDYIGNKPRTNGRESTLARRDRQRDQMFADLDGHAPVIPIGALGA